MAQLSVQCGNIQLKCDVCLDKKNHCSIMKLPCHHTFCLECIQSLPKEMECGKLYIKCPRCNYCDNNHYFTSQRAANLLNGLFCTNEGAFKLDTTSCRKSTKTNYNIKKEVDLSNIGTDNLALKVSSCLTNQSPTPTPHDGPVPSLHDTWATNGKATLKVLPCLANQLSTAILTLQSQDGSPFSPPSSLISSTLVCSLTGSRHQSVKCDITPVEQEGKYKITFTPSTTRQDQLIVQIGGVDVSDSPFILPVMTAPDMSSKPINIITGLNEPWGIATCDNGDIVVAEYGAHCITILNKEGEKVRSFGTKGTKEGQFTHPRGVAITNDGHILVIDKHRLQKLTTDGACVKSIGNRKSRSGQGRLKHPSGITVHPTTGEVFIADSSNNCVQVFNNDLTFSHAITQYGKRKYFKCPCYVALDNKGCLYVAELHNNCITKLTTTGEFILQYISQGSFPNQLYGPSCLVINNNIVYIGSNSYLSIFDTEGNYLNCLSKLETATAPLGIAVDAYNSLLYYTDHRNNRVIVF